MTLRRRLVLGIVALLALVSIVIGIASVAFLRGTLMAQLDRQLEQSSDRTLRAIDRNYGDDGGGSGFWPPQLRPDDLDAVKSVSSDEAMAMARRAAREEGLWSGPSTGANLVAALRVARELGEGRRVATVLVDSGLKYLGGSLYA